MRDSFISFFILKSVTAVRSINFIIFIRSKSDNRFISITYRLNISSRPRPLVAPTTQRSYTKAKEL